MCGIAGTAGGPPDRALLGAMADEMAHRGPDAAGVWAGDEAGFAFRRLAIIDLDERSNQPMQFGRLRIVFNGEIYNYRELKAELAGRGHVFATEGDTEVLLHAWAEWGEAALDRLNGMFAFAVWDEQDRSLTLATDPFGEKPVYWWSDGDRFAFASDIRALFCDPSIPSDPDAGALQRYLALGLVPARDESFFAGVKRLPASHLLRRRDGRTSVRAYWTPRRREVPARYEDATAELRDLLADSVRLRLRSDVPVGTSLSGGTDSSAIVALVAQTSPEARRHSFTARFPGFERDEWHYAELAADAAGVLEHHATCPTAGELLADLERLVLAHEEPVASSSIYAQYRVMALAKEAGVVVLLDGQGGDELFAGYHGMAGHALRSRDKLAALGELTRRPGALRDLALSFGIDAAASSRTAGRAAARFRRGIASPYADRDAVGGEMLERPHGGGFDRLRRELLVQSFDASLPQLLRYADRSSMAHSREVRLPFLDRRIAEFAWSVPAEWIHSGGQSKRILRDAVAGLVPAPILARRDKVGFETPQARWLAEPAARERIAEVLLDPSARARGLYDSEAVEGDLRAGRWRNTDAVWRALNAELWTRELLERR